MSMASGNIAAQPLAASHDEPNLLAGGVLVSLSRSWGDGGAWGAVRSFIFGGITFGIVPLIVWTKRFRHFIDVEQQLLWHLAEWMRLRTGSAEARQLRDLSERIRFRPALAVLSLGALACVVLAFVMRHGTMFDGSILLGSTYY